MPTIQQLTDRLEDLYSELEALRYYRRKKLITAPGFASQKAKIQRSIDVAEDRLYDARLKETKIKADQARRKAQADAMRAVLLAEDKARYKASLHQRFLTQDEIRIELQPTEEGVEPLSPLSDAELLDFITRQPGRWVIQVGEVHYTLNDATKMKLQELVTAGLVEEDFGLDSDGVLLTAIYEASFLIVRRVTEQQKGQYGFIDEGAFFPYYHNTHFDLKRFQIFKNGSEANYEDNCLLHAFAVAGVKQETLDLLKTKVKNRNVPVKVMEDIAQTLKMKIVVKTKDVNHRDRRVYGKEFSDVMPLGLLEGHYFFIEKTTITSYCLDHYEELKDVKDCNLIYNSLGMKNKDRCVDSYDVVKHLLANKQLLTPISMDDALIATTQFYDQANQTITSLEFEEDKCVRPVIQKKKEGKKEKKKFVNVFFDFETDPNNEHIPYLCRTFDGSTHREFIGENCAYDMLCSMTANTRFIAHNATYDYRFIIKYLHNISEISRGTRLISCSAEFGDKLIQVKDSFHLISHPLRKFPEMFGITDTVSGSGISQPLVKEVMPYKLYTQENIKKRFVPIDEALGHINEKDRQQFLDNLKRWNLIKGETYDIITYSSLYCKIDCEILYKGYTTFREWVLKALNIDIDDVLTTASLADLYFRNEGCYDDVNELSGIPQLFIQGCVVGGRTMCAENKMIKVEAKINDFDAVSLYPSAMYRMDGFLKGSPKVLKDMSYEFLQKQDGYFVDIVIKSVGIPRKFPLMSYMNEGVRNFTNDMIGRTMRVDKYTLEDLIRFHNITFDVVRGYYFNNGFNTKIKDTILFCFLERLKLKKEKNPAQEIYKLLMNSGYGKTIMKPVDSQVKFFEGKTDFETYHRRHYNWITSHIYFGNKVRCDMVKPLNEHYNRAHIGTCILSMSKRIMNEVMCLADDEKIDIYYQDTDSMHLQDKNISVLSSRFKEIYGRELIGKNFGQFHSDFDIKGASNVFSRRAIFLGKKAYIDELVGQDQDGKDVIDYHIRLKGIPNSVILHHVETHGFKNPFELYESLSRGDTVAFDLTNNGTKPNFKFNKNYTINTLSIFTRAVKYGA